ncbi:GTPase Era [Crocinitomicaceae bacterium CZZ-1]|uniref:GTPase Era n=1 Tax=Taishania pollutisoli TaxID=2766479 RepID=A0A8J6PAJ9_9FLAO|nr:GTPase Era [Taishania pollutisoli]MBC9813426.1 GTPase Era [Taishania pollutisoli]MBX2950687.1 GTPase Era [Crocinitomicaceae bacterium]NGF76534.1 GTPase Era [Fluviicola sp. SGL-29]
MAHKSGFVNIVGSPNVGKSTLMNQLVGEKLSIVTSKAQTTRHRILGIVNDENYQIVFSDTPGVVNAAYKLHEQMMGYVNTSIQDADVLLFITDMHENEMNHKETLERIAKLQIPVLCLINKVDLGDQQKVIERVEYWQQKLPNAIVFPISALHKFNVDAVWEKILELVPESPAYFDKEAISDRPMRFFVSEIIREKIFIHCQKEVPYSCQVEIEEYLEEENITRIRALIIVERDSQKGIIIGKGGIMLKRLGREARLEIEKFIEGKVFLETFVKVDKDWRGSDQKLKKYGY